LGKRGLHNFEDQPPFREVQLSDPVDGEITFRKIELNVLSLPGLFGLATGSPRQSCPFLMPTLAGQAKVERNVAMRIRLFLGQLH
jgi:hypothetical protein